MNIKAIIAGLVITASSIMVPEAVKANTSGETNLWNAIETAGVTITVDECDRDGTMGWFSYYSGSYRDMAIQICTNTAETGAERWETLRHEAVHLAQKCENPSHGDTFETLTTTNFLINNGTDSDWNFVKRNYPEDKWLIEYEAFTLMGYDNQVIADVVNEACN